MSARARYARILRTPHVRPLVIAAMVARLPIGMDSLAIVLFLRQRTGSYAVAGVVAACALVRPTGIEGMTPKSVKKKLKQPSFAAGVNRDEVRAGAEELGVDFDEHVAFLISAMEERADTLGLSATQVAS